ncbi:MAG: hypothetical protein LBQ31_04395 [Bacteroidales bacterium]|jgi:hypothetical protein|nr:hypothetical protein [Bacteroidales bacterium]
MKTKIFFTVMLSLFCSGIQAQSMPPVISCANDDNASGGVKGYFTDQWVKEYRVDFEPSSEQPIIYVRLNLVFLQRTDGTGGFHEDSIEHQSLIDDGITALNNAYSSLQDPGDSSCYKGNDFIGDTRIRFLSNKIYVKNNYWWNNGISRCPSPTNQNCSSLCPNYNGWHLDSLDQIIVNDTTIPRGINIYFTQDSFNYNHMVEIRDSLNLLNHGVACSEFPNRNVHNHTSQLHMPDMYSTYWWFRNVFCPTEGISWENETRNGWYVPYLLGKNLAHEIGHSLSLTHEGDFYDKNGCNDAVMYTSVGTGKNGVQHERNYIPPPEIGEMYLGFSFANLRSFIPDNTYLGVKTISKTNYTMPYNMRLYHSLRIIDTASLTITKNITMPSDAEVEVYGRLIINNANITSIGDNWKGIRVKNNGYLEITSGNISDYNISVENGGRIVFNSGVVVSGDHSITIDSGGYLCLKNPITLTDFNSRLKISDGVHWGVPGLTSCGSSTSSIAIGNGVVVYTDRDVYIQNETINTNRYIGGRKIYVGQSVTTTIPYGDVSITNGANVVFEGQEIIFSSGFLSETGATFMTR